MPAVFPSRFVSAALFLGGSLGPVAGAVDPARFLYPVRAYADALLAHGTDTYGREHSPLLASALDRTTLRLPADLPRRTEGMRMQDCVVTGANPMHDENLYRLLYALTPATGDALDTARALLAPASPPAGRTLYPGAFAAVIGLLVRAHHHTGEAVFLNRADDVAAQAIELFWDQSPLPRASTAHDHYESLTRADSLAVALLELWSAHTQPQSPLLLDYIDR